MRMHLACLLRCVQLPCSCPPPPASPADGVGIAWAVSEALLAAGAPTLFATHFAELAELAAVYPAAKAWHFDVGDVAGRRALDFSWRLQAGSCEAGHYGLLLAAAVGFPDEVLASAGEVVAGARRTGCMCMPTSVSRAVSLHQTSSLACPAAWVSAVGSCGLATVASQHPRSLAALTDHSLGLHAKPLQRWTPARISGCRYTPQRAARSWGRCTMWCRSWRAWRRATPMAAVMSASCAQPRSSSGVCEPRQRRPWQLRKSRGCKRRDGEERGEQGQRQVAAACTLLLPLPLLGMPVCIQRRCRSHHHRCTTCSR